MGKKRRGKPPSWLRSAQPTKPEKKLVFVGVTAMGGKVGIGVVDFIQYLQALAGHPDCPFRFVWEICNDVRPVEYARNKLCQTLLTRPELKDAIGLWFVDSDMIPHQNAVEMLHVEADIVAAMAMAFDHKTDKHPARVKICLFRHNPKNNKFDSIIPKVGDTVVDIDAAGTASMFIRRKVLEDPNMRLDPGFEYLDGSEMALDESDAPPIFRTLYKPNGEILRGEDLDFSWRAKQAGYRIVGHVGVRYGHVKAVDLDQMAVMMSNIADAIKQESDHADVG